LPVALIKSMHALHNRTWEKAGMVATRRPEDESRALLIEAATDLINTEGYAALTARKLAGKVGRKRQIVHYYFRIMDDLLLAVIHH
jgi:AcrR family transcriptional regulator